MIVAIGGSASVGKTSVAAELAGTLGLDAIVHVDDIAADHERDVAPSFISSTADVWRRPADWRHDRLIEWTARLHPRVEQVIGDLLCGEGGVVEGEGIEPRLLRRWPADLVKVVYIIETDPDLLHRTFASRPSSARFRALPAVEQDAVVDMNLRYGRWLRHSADAHRQPWVSSRPWATLSRRLRDALGL